MKREPLAVASRCCAGRDSVAKQSAGILLYRQGAKGPEVLLVHPGGPFWAKKDRGAWSIPKGEFDPDEESLAAAKREFEEETGSPAPGGEYQSLGENKQSSGKVVHIFVLEADFDLSRFQSNQFEMEWPPKSGQEQQFAEVDKAAWTPLAKATQSCQRPSGLYRAPSRAARRGTR